MAEQAPYATTEPWLLLRHPQVRALAFAIGSAPLLQHWPSPDPLSIELPDGRFWQQQLQRYWPRLLQLDADPRPLQQALSMQRMARLGYYFEDLLAFWLSDAGWHEFRLLGHSIQQMQGRRTVGELDFLLKNLESGEIEHWEVCIKFYLGEGRLQPAEWVGLQRHDTLGRKLQHLQQRQFLACDGQGLPIDRRRAIIKGRLFWPQLSRVDLPTLTWLNPAQLSGRWQSGIAALDSSWRRAERLEWLVESPPACLPSQPTRYWCNGLYLRQLTQQHTQQRLMLRLDTPLLQPPNRLNISHVQGY